jgi:glycosyltransferase involved in cell wall biosynthesis
LMYRKLSRMAPDAIILHSVKAMVPCAIYSRLHQIPLLAVEHQANSLKTPTEWWISRMLMRCTDAVIVLTPEYRLELQHRLSAHWRDSKVHVIPNGIDTNAYQPNQASKSPSSRRVIGMASRMTEIKRQDLLIEAVALLCEQDGHDAWKLSLAGEGDTLEALRARVNALNLAEVVSFPGYLGESALQDWFKDLDIYAHASEGETLSTSLLQALAMGLPVVGSNVAGINTLLGSGGGVGITAEQTPGAFAKVIRQLADNPDLASGLGTRGRELVLHEYGQQGMFQKYRGILDSLCVG